MEDVKKMPVVPETAIKAIKSAPAPQQPVLASKDPLETVAQSLCEQLGHDFVTLTVGPTHEKFTVHKDLLCATASYFKSMFTEGFSETNTSTADFPEDSPAAFRLFVVWMYTGKFEILHINGKNVTRDQYVRDLIHLFGLAEKFVMPELADTTMTAFLAYLNAKDCFPEASDMKLAYSVTHSGSRLRLFMARVHIYATLHYSTQFWDSEELVEALRNIEDLLRDTCSMLRLQAGKLRIDPTDEHNCSYHQHNDAKECPYIEKENAVKTEVKK